MSALIVAALTFDRPAWLALTLLAVPAVVLGRHGFAQASAFRRALALAARAALITLTAVLLAGPGMVNASDRLAVVALVDASGSVRHLAGAGAGGSGRDTADIVEAVGGWLASIAEARTEADLLGVVAFARDPRVLAVPTARGPVSLGGAPWGESGSDLASAVRTALALSPPDAALRLVLVSDGNETEGNLLQAAREAVAAGPVPIDVVPVEYDVTREIAVEGVDAPPRADPGSPVTLRVRVRATAPGRAVLTLAHNGTPVDLDPAGPGTGRAVDVPAGLSVHLLEAPTSGALVHRYRVAVGPHGDGAAIDTLAENNWGEAFTLTPGRGTVLVVDPDAELARATAGRLRGLGLDAIPTSPGALAPDVLEWYRHDLVVLQNVPAEMVGQREQAAMTEYVRAMGGGLLVTGGPDAFGAGGWRGTPLAEMLPVLLDLPARLVVPDVAVVFVLDRSGSMGRPVLGSSRTQQRIANESAATAILRLDRRDLVGVISFDGDWTEVVPLGPNTDPEASARRVRAIRPGGGTMIGPALVRAAEMLRGVEARARHVILLTDGESDDRDRLPALASRLAHAGIVLSTIAVGDQADAPLLDAMAQRTGGAFHEVLNPAVLPQVFLRAVRFVRSPMIRREPFTPRRVVSAASLMVDVPDPPPLEALNMTQPRPTPGAVVSMTTPDGLPVLAHWGAGLGRVTALMTDPQRWGPAWESWDGYGTFWLALVRATARATTEGPARLAVARDGAGLAIRLEVIDPDGRPVDGLAAPATVFRPDGTSEEIALTQTGPGVYEGRAEAAAPGTYVCIARPRGEGEGAPITPAVGGVSVSGGIEYRRLRSNGAILRSVAQMTGGRVFQGLPRSEQVFDRAGLGPVVSYQPLWRPVLVWVLVVALIDIAMRRIAWDRLLVPGGGRALLEQARLADRFRSRRAQATTAGARARLAAVQRSLDDDSLALTDTDAEELRRHAARERRRPRPPEPAQESDQVPAGEGHDRSDRVSPLLEARRRARERMEGDEP